MSAFTVLLSAWLFIHSSPPVADLNVHISAKILSVNGSGLQADYYNGINFEEKVLSRIEKQIDFSFLGNSPAPGVHAEDFSVRWTGKLFAPENGVYKFMVRADDGVRIWLGNQLILDAWYLQQETFYERKVLLKANQYYDLKVEYYNHELHAVMQLYWVEPPKTDGQVSSKIIIPQKNLFSPNDKTQPVATTTTAKKPVANKPSTDVPKKEVAMAAPTTPKPTVVKTEAQSPKITPKDTTSEVKLPTTPKSEDNFEQWKVGESIILKNVLFEQSKYVLLDDSYSALDKLVFALKKYPQLQIEIAGHTDNWGDPRLNQALSENRAHVIASYLVRQGIAESRITWKGYGDTRPIADNSIEEERAKNRRVEFMVK